MCILAEFEVHLVIFRKESLTSSVRGTINMKKLLSKQPVIFLFSALLSLFTCGICFFLLWSKTAAMPQIFTDIIIENLAINGTNKTGEIQLFYTLLLLGCVLFAVLYFLLSFLFNKNESFTDTSSPLESPLSVLFLFLLPLLLRLIFYGKLSIPLCFFSIIIVILHVICKTYLKEAFIFYIFTYYSCVALFTALAKCSLINAVSSNTLYLLTFLSATTFLLICLFFKNISLLNYGILLLQLLFPFLFLVYFIDSYLYRGSVVRIPYAKGYYVFFGILFAGNMLLMIKHVHSCIMQQKQFNNTTSVTTLTLSGLICKITPIILFTYHSFCAAPMYAQPDQHHHGEQMIPWQQVITLSQNLYEDYTPVSGLFPFLSGGIQHLLLNGTVSDYAPAISISMVLFCILTMYLLVKHVDTFFGVLFAVFFTLPCYNRQYFVLPLLLLLFLPKLLKKPNLWLKVWLLSCFVAGLYYPLFGGAVVVGTAPLVCYQIYHFVKSGEAKQLLSNPSFYLCWGICLVPVFISIPLLLKMLKHTLTYSSQTILADGIALWGQVVPEYFMSYLGSSALRHYCYFGLRFLLPAIGIWAFFFLLVKHLLVPYHNSKLFTLALVSGILTLLVSYSYTLVRADTNMLLSRTSYILVAVVGMFLPVILLTYGKNYFSASLINIIVACCFSLPLFLYQQNADLKRPDLWVYPDGQSELLLSDAAKIYSYYEVPANFVLGADSELTEEQIKILGSGFMVEDQQHYVLDYDRVMDKCEEINPDMTYIGLDGQGFFYYTNSKACGTGFLQAAKGYDAQMALLEVIASKRPVAFLIEPESTYYIYAYLLENDYVYCKEDAALYPRELYKKLYLTEPDDYRDTCQNKDFGLVAASFGNSSESLLKLMTPMSALEDDSNFTPFKGSDYDFIYVTLTDETVTTLQTLTVSFTFSTPTKETMITTGTAVCTLKGNQLLIPMGMNPSWFLSTIEEISFTGTTQSGETIPLTSEEMSFKLYEIRK